MTLPNKFQLYLGPQSVHVEASMKKTGKSLSAEVRDRIRKSYEAETIIRNLLGIIEEVGRLGDGPVVTVSGSDIQQAKDYLK